MGLLTNEGEGGKKALCHSHPTMMKLGTITSYPKKIQKIYESQILLTLAFFHQRSAYFAISTNTDIDCILIHGGGGGSMFTCTSQHKQKLTITRTDSDDESEIMKTFQNLLHITAKNQHSPIIHLKN